MGGERQRNIQIRKQTRSNQPANQTSLWLFSTKNELNKQKQSSKFTTKRKSFIFESSDNTSKCKQNRAEELNGENVPRPKVIITILNFSVPSKITVPGLNLCAFTTAQILYFCLIDVWMWVKTHINDIVLICFRRRWFLVESLCVPSFLSMHFWPFVAKCTQSQQQQQNAKYQRLTVSSIKLECCVERSDEKHLLWASLSISVSDICVVCVGLEKHSHQLEVHQNHSNFR